MKSFAAWIADMTAGIRIPRPARDIAGRARRAGGRLYRRMRGTDRPSTAQLVALMGISDLVVRHGPFQGMRYPRLTTYGSVLLPKLIGCYERELHPAIERLGRDYATVVNVGCAEGYYAVGMARRMPQARVYAFDGNGDAIADCREMAEMNGVETKRLITGGACTSDTLRSLDLGKRALVISDCEGYERELFGAATAGSLRSHDLIIETHDFLGSETSPHIKRVFASTHDIESVFSTDDVQKARTYDYPELEHLPPDQRLQAVEERRSAIMEWLIVRSRAHHGSGAASR